LPAGTRPAAELIVNAEDAVSLRKALAPGDLIIDTAGPFQHRTLALLKTACEIGCDIIDVNDHLAYAQQVLALEAEIFRAGIRVLSSASSVSAIAAALLHESGADSVYLPRIWPSLQDVAMYVDANTPGVNMLLCAAAHLPALRWLLLHTVNWGTEIARMIGSRAGGIGYEIEDAAGYVARFALLSAQNSFLVAVAPAVLAAQAMVAGPFQPTGLVLPHKQIEPAELWAFFKSHGIEIARLS
jgi:hypothetical protein